MKKLKLVWSLALAGALVGCGSTPKGSSIDSVDNYSGEYAEHRSYALNLMEAAKLGGAKDVKLKDGDSVIDLTGSNAASGFVSSFTSGGSLLTASLSGLAGGLFTPDSDAQYNQAIGVIDITNLKSGVDVDAYARKALLDKLGALLTATVGTDESNFYTNTWARMSDDHWSTTNKNGQYGKVYTGASTHEVCKELRSEKLDEAVSYNAKFDKNKNLDWEKERFGDACGIRVSSMSVRDIVDTKKLPWLEIGKKYIVVTAEFGTSISLNTLSGTTIPTEGLYLYYTANGANTGKMKDTSYPYIQAPDAKEMYFIKLD